MALTIDGPTAIIDVPQADLTYDVATDAYVLDTDAFRLELRDWEDGPDGIVWTKTHDHNTESTLAGTTFARQVIIRAPWRVRFENTGSAYTVRIEGSNNNLLDGDVLIPTPLVSYVATNSAGLIVREGTTSGLTPTESANLALILALMRSGRTLTTDGSGDVVITIGPADGGGSYTTSGWEDEAGTTPQTGGIVRRTDPLPDTLDP